VHRFKRFLAVLHARNVEFIRDRTALSWNIILPILLVAGFAFLFSKQANNSYKVVVIGDGLDVKEYTLQHTKLLSKSNKFFLTKYVKFIPGDKLEAGIDKVRRHKVDMLIKLDTPVKYWINASSKKGYVLEKILLLSQSTGVEISNPPSREMVKGKEINEIDWLIPGILAMNIMFSCLFGIGYVIVRYRKMGVLKRFQATPLTAFEFLAAQIVSRLCLIMIITTIVFIGCVVIVDLNVVGGYFPLFIVFLLGSTSLISLGLIVAARSTSEEYANGILNLLSWPMMIFSGVWFSLEGLHPAAQVFAQALPLTHMIEAARAIINEGKTLLDVSYNLVALAAMTVGFIIIGAVSFKWDRF